MKKHLQAAALLSLFIASPGHTTDLIRGKTLVEENCVRCHGSEVYTRQDRRVTTLPGLQKQVQRCEQMLELTLITSPVTLISNTTNSQ
jgi:cytochrome c553